MNSTTTENVLMTGFVTLAVFFISEPPLANALQSTLIAGALTYGALIIISDKPDYHITALNGAVVLCWGVLKHFNLMNADTTLYLVTVANQSPTFSTTHLIAFGVLLLAGTTVGYFTYATQPTHLYIAGTAALTGIFALFAGTHGQFFQNSTPPDSPLFTVLFVLTGTGLIVIAAHKHYTQPHPAPQ